MGLFQFTGYIPSLRESRQKPKQEFEAETTEDYYAIVCSR